MIEAALGALYNKASSPKTSPGIYFLSNVGSYYPFMHDRLPDSTTYRQSTLSPYLITTSPFFSIFFSCIASIIMFFSDSSKLENIKDFSKFIFIFCLT